MSLSDIIMYGFLVAQREKVSLWGLNTSSADRNLRDNIPKAWAYQLIFLRLDPQPLKS